MSEPSPAHAPPSVRISRRSFLVGTAGLAGAAALGGLTACAGQGQPTPAPTVTLGSNYADDVPRRAMQAVIDEFTRRSGIAVSVNTIAPQPFQERIAAYLQGMPDDVFTWFAGQRMRFFADQGLASDISDVWQRISDHHSEASRVAATGSDGRQYLVPFITYPWVVLYRRSVWQQFGYEEPATLDEFRALCQQMQADGLVPLAFGNREGWPAMGTFDILNLRHNGYDFHIDLLAGGESWTDPRVGAVFELWRELLPFHQAGALGRTWQEAARSMIAAEAGMIFLATFAGEQASDEQRDDLAMIFLATFAGEQASDEQRDDLAMFHFPLLGTQFDDELAVDAPINGFMLSRNPAEPAAARDFLEFLGTPAAQQIYVAENPNRIAVARDADTSGYTDFQRQMAQIIAGAGRMAQFLDRDSRPDFAGANGMQAFLADFIHDPDQDTDALLGRIQTFWDALD